jgi:hypothetical protein
MSQLARRRIEQRIILFVEVVFVQVHFVEMLAVEVYLELLAGAQRAGPLPLRSHTLRSRNPSLRFRVFRVFRGCQGARESARRVVDTSAAASRIRTVLP